MLAVLRQRNFGLLWWGGLISLTGDWMLRIALPAHVFNLTHSTLATGAMFIAGTVPDVLLGSVAGVFLDRWDRRRTMVVVNLLLALTLLPLLLVRSAEWLGLVYAVAFIQSVLRQFFDPAENALLPTLVGEDKLLTANALNALNNNLARLIGPGLGGALALTVGLFGVTVIDTGTFLAAALLIFLIRPPARPPSTTLPVALSPGAVGREWLAGLRLVRQNRTVSLLFVLAALTSVGEGIIGVLFIPFVTAVLGAQALELGWLMSAQAVGGLLGGMAVARVGARFSHKALLVVGGLLFGLIDLAIFNYSTFVQGFWIALSLFVLVGFPGAAFSASFSTLLQGSVADEYRGRIFGALNTTLALLMLLGMGFASVAGDVLGIVPVINVQGFGYVLAGLLVLVLMRPPPRVAGPTPAQAP